MGLINCLFLLQFAFLAVWAASCKNSDYTILGNGKCYRAYKTLATFDKASLGCHLTGGELASIHSETDNYIVGMWLSGSQLDDAWIGLTCDDDGDCSWLDGSALDYTHFEDTPPDLDNGHCFYMKPGMSDFMNYNFWANANCKTKKKMSICMEVDHIPTRKPPTTTTVLPQGCGNYAEFNGLCYHVGTGDLPEAQAQAVCASEGGNLVSIHDELTDQFIVNLLQAAGVQFTAWIGLQYLYNGQHIWTDYSPVDYINYAPNMVANPGACFAISDVQYLYPGQWLPQNCSTSLPYVCERQKFGKTTTRRTTTTTTTTTAPPRSNCGAPYYFGSEGRIVSPNYPYSFNGASCNYFINASMNAVNIQVPAIQAQGFWTLSLYEGSVPSPQFLIRSISSYDAPEVLKYSSPTSEMLVNFYASDGDIGQPFFMVYNTSSVPLFPIGNLTITTTLPPQMCDNGLTYDAKRRFCYGVYQTPATFANAQIFCTSLNGHMASVHNSAEEDDLFGILASNYQSSQFNVWLGGQFIDNIWQWNDGTAMVYRDWLGGVPRGAPGQCVAAVSYSYNNQGWESRDCTQRLPFICVVNPYH